MGDSEETQAKAAVLQDLASAVEGAVGFESVVVNLYRAEEDNYEVVVLRGPDDLRAAVEGEAHSRESWRSLLEARFERFGTFFVPEGEGDRGDAPASEPELDAGEGENRWRKGDALFALIRCSHGTILGILSVAFPSDGQRPSERQRLKLNALCAQAGRALEAADPRYN